MHVYSPSQTALFSECQVKRELRMWQPKYATKGHVARWMGTGMAAGLASYNEWKRQGLQDNWSVQSACDVAQVTFDEEMIAFQKAGGVVTMNQYEHVLPLMDRALKAYVKADPVKWLIRDVEKPLSEHGDCRPDLVVHQGEVAFAPLDYKMKEKLWVKTGETIESARNRTLIEYEHSWQMLHYVWAVREMYGQCDGYYICLGELSPKPHYTVQFFQVSDEVMERWERSALSYWENMDMIDYSPVEGPYAAMAANHRNQYGQCEYYWACFEANLDPEKMRYKYVQVERRRERATEAAE